MRFIENILPLLVFISIFACGGTDYSGNEEEVNPLDVVDVTKLLGTPLEGLTNGDNLDPNQFLCGQYRTETINGFPIKVFTAFFTALQESVVQEGVNIANEAMGFTAYEITETWSDDVRIIYHVEEIDGTSNAIGKTYSTDFTFDGYVYSRNQSVDWIVEISFTDKWVIAHELGHASGIDGHFLIDYENDAMLDLEENSLMEANTPSSPELTDYNFMMSAQGQIMTDHLGEEGTIDNDPCE